jgi:hypothetical protein
VINNLYLHAVRFSHPVRKIVLCKREILKWDLNMKTLILISTLLLSTSIFANRVYCTSSNSGSNCSFADMKLYNQRIVSDMHCGPTSGAMALSALTYGGASYYTNSWTKKNFVYKSTSDRITNMGDYMGTSSTGGSSWSGIKKLKNREADFPSASGYTRNSSSMSIYTTYLKGRTQAREVNILDYGHYTESCLAFGPYTFCSYDRNGGHVVAVKGFKKISGITNTVINDPWNAVTYNSKIKYLSDKTNFPLLDMRPYGSRTRMLKESGSSKKIIDFAVGIKTN